MAKTKTSGATRPRRRMGWGMRLFVAFLVVTIALPVGLVGVYRFVPPPITYLMVERLVEGRGLTKSWRSLDDISPYLAQAVIAAEDARFCTHHGFEFEAMKKALESNQRRPNRIRGGSTISQQTAKNVFLWPGRSYVRKGLEAYFTVLLPQQRRRIVADGGFAAGGGAAEPAEVEARQARPLCRPPVTPHRRRGRHGAPGWHGVLSKTLG